MTIENCSVTGNLANENARLKETIAAQAAVIEKLRDAVTELNIFVQRVTHWEEGCYDRHKALQDAREAIATPTNSKEVLKEWLDEVLGGPVGWLQTSVEEGLDTTLLRCHKPKKFNPEWWKFEPLFRKPEVK